ncbi:MAG: hypothetical protein WDN28_26545 [Chthoniobacter sp.]
MQKLRLKLANSMALAHQFVHVVFALTHESVAFLLHHADDLILHPVGDFQITEFVPKRVGFTRVFRRAGVRFRSVPNLLRRRIGWNTDGRLLGLLFADGQRDALRRNEILSFVRVEKSVEPCHTLVICLAPINDASLGARYAGLFEKTGDFAHSERVLFGAFRTIPHVAEWFRGLRNLSEAFRILRKSSEACRSVRKISEPLGRVIDHDDCLLLEAARPRYSEVPISRARPWLLMFSFYHKMQRVRLRLQKVWGGKKGRTSVALAKRGLHPKGS